MTTVEILTKARAKISTTRKWGKGPNLKGKKRCASLAFGIDDPSCAERFFWRVIGVDGLGGIWAWNDAPERTHAEVMDAFDRAIELAKQEEAK